MSVFPTSPLSRVFPRVSYNLVAPSLSHFQSYFILFILILRIHLQCFLLSLKPKAVHSLDILISLFQRVCMGTRAAVHPLRLFVEHGRTSKQTHTKARTKASVTGTQTMENRRRSRIQLREVGNICERLQMLCLNLRDSIQKHICTTFSMKYE